MEIQKSRGQLIGQLPRCRNCCSLTLVRLLRAAREAGNSQLEACEYIVHNIQEDHLKSANAYIRSVDIINELALRTTEECRELRLDLAAAQRIGESPGFVDRIISRGEILSCRFVAALLQDRGISARFVDLSEIINFQIAGELDREFYQRLTTTLSEEVRVCGDQIPVLTGYWGSVPGEFTLEGTIFSIFSPWNRQSMTASSITESLVPVL